MLTKLFFHSSYFFSLQLSGYMEILCAQGQILTSSVVQIQMKMTARMRVQEMQRIVVLVKHVHRLMNIHLFLTQSLASVLHLCSLNIVWKVLDFYVLIHTGMGFRNTYRLVSTYILTRLTLILPFGKRALGWRWLWNFFLHIMAPTTVIFSMKVKFNVSGECLLDGTFLIMILLDRMNFLASCYWILIRKVCLDLSTFFILWAYFFYELLWNGCWDMNFLYEWRSDFHWITTVDKFHMFMMVTLVFVSSLS